MASRYEQLTARDRANLAALDDDDEEKSSASPRARDAKAKKAKCLAGRKGGRTRAERQRLILAQGPTEIVTALNALVRMVLAGEDPWGLMPVRALHRALGAQGELFLGEHMPTPEGDALAQYTAIMVLSPIVNALAEMTNLIGPGGLVPDVDRRVATLQDAWRRQDEEIERFMWDQVNAGIARFPTLLARIMREAGNK
jgi:hypothetical protein